MNWCRWPELTTLPGAKLDAQSAPIGFRPWKAWISRYSITIRAGSSFQTDDYVLYEYGWFKFGADGRSLILILTIWLQTIFTIWLWNVPQKCTPNTPLRMHDLFISVWYSLTDVYDIGKFPLPCGNLGFLGVCGNRITTLTGEERHIYQWF